MKNTESKKEKLFKDIDFSNLMDLRVDYAFKLAFKTGNNRFLISLLNAVFVSKNLPRKIKSLTIIDPHLNKKAKNDKLSILDLRAQLDDGTGILIEMHLYNLVDLKYKTIRSWARAYGEDLKEGEDYIAQSPVICVAFADGSLDGRSSKKIHKCCMITDIDDHTVFTDAMQLHYINMKAFIESVNQTGGIQNGETRETMLQKWLTVITQNVIEDKAIIKNICEQEEEIGMFVSELARLSEDAVVRQQYQSRKEYIMLYNKQINEYKDGKDQADQRAEKERKRAEKERKRAEKADQRAIKAENALESQKATISNQEATISNQEATISDQAKIIAELLARLAKNTES